MLFYIFNKERNFAKNKNDDSELEKLKSEYTSFMSRLDTAAELGEVSLYDRRVIIDMSKMVLEGLARNYGKVKQEVEGIMGGRVLEHEGKTILNQGIAIVEKRGRSDTLNATIDFMRSNGMSNEQINDLKKLILSNLNN